MKDKELKQLILQLQEKTKIDTKELMGTSTKVEVAESKNVTIFLINDKPMFARKDDLVFPALGSDDVKKFLPQVVVNMGAVPHVCNGADVMAPGIVNVKGDFGKDEFVVVVDEQHQSLWQ